MLNAPGPILRDEMLEARGRTAFPLDRGQTVRVVDVDGHQVADFVCFRRPDTSEKLSVHNTALIQGTIHISTGHLLLSDRCGTLMTITADTCGWRGGHPQLPVQLRGSAAAVRDPSEGGPLQLQHLHERSQSVGFVIIHGYLVKYRVS